MGVALIAKTVFVSLRIMSAALGHTLPFRKVAVS